MLIKENDNCKLQQINFRNVDSLLGAQFIFDLYDQYVDDLNVFRYRNVAVYYENDKVFSYSPESDWKYINHMICNKFLNLDEDLINLISYYVKREKKYIFKLWDQIEKIDLDTIKKEKIANLLYKWYYTSLNDIFKLNLAPIEYGVTEAIKKILIKLKSKTVDKDVVLLLSFEKRTVAIQEEYDMLNLIINNPQINENCFDFIEHYEKYKSLRCAYGNKPWDITYFISKLNTLKKMHILKIEQRIKEIEAYPKKIRKNKEICLEQYNDHMLRNLSNIGCEIGELRDCNKALLGKSILYRNILLESVCKKCNIHEDDLKYYLLDEIFLLLTKNIKISYNELEERKKGVLLQSSLTKCTDNKAREYFNHRINSIKDINAFSLKGVCASTGEISGKVKLCHCSDECNKVQKGDILVAYGTDFDFIEAISKAGAIITEEGGILSHASVISRELKIPCIIGMKNAMKVLKENQIIRINADKGCVVEVQDIIKKNIQKRKGIYDLSEYDNHSIDNTGGKAQNLSRLKQMGFNVMDGFVISIKYFINLLKEQFLYNDYVNIFELNNENEMSSKVIKIINKINFDMTDISEWISKEKMYAVRSSGAAEDGTKVSFAGQHYTALFCNGYESIKNSIINCWKSYGSPAAILYRNKMKLGFNNLIGAVIIQEILNSEYSGVLFTKNPINNKHEIMIEACKGQCYKVVDGGESPTRYILDFYTGQILEKNINNDVVINDTYLQELVNISKKLEKEFKKPVDIEWGLYQGKIFLFQCRYITT